MQVSFFAILAEAAAAESDAKASSKDNVEDASPRAGDAQGWILVQKPCAPKSAWRTVGRKVARKVHPLRPSLSLTSGVASAC